MSRDRQLLLLMHGGASVWETLGAWTALAFSAQARTQYRRFATVTAVLRYSLADSDDLVVIQTRARSTGIGRQHAAWLLLALLCLVATFEWKDYTLPALSGAIREAAHRCGLG